MEGLENWATFYENLASNNLSKIVKKKCGIFRLSTFYDRAQDFARSDRTRVLATEHQNKLVGDSVDNPEALPVLIHVFKSCNYF